MKAKNEYSLLMDLYSKPASYKFSDDEIKFIKKHVKKSSYVVRYAFYNKHSSRDKYIIFIIDGDRSASRRSGVENNWEYHSERELTDIEFLEIIQNFGCNKRRFQVWNYAKIEQLMADDLKYNIETPQGFVNEARKRGYYGNYQTKINFENDD